MLQSIDARSGLSQGETWPESTPAEIDAAVMHAASAADRFAATSAVERAGLLHALAGVLEAHAEPLCLLADRETGLGLPRLGGEVERTCFQLRGFAQVLLSGGAHPFLDQAAVAGPPPGGRPRITRVALPLGPVAVFAASNFPFAFSVLGGDTASALAAGCPVVLKAHPAHPELSRQVAALAAEVIAACGFDAGVFQFVQGGSIEVGVQLVKAPDISAVAFTGSFKGGTALSRIASDRPRPIPFYGELGSVNPVVVLPDALARDVMPLAQGLAASITLGAGQFCTSPGLIVVMKGTEGDTFVRSLADALTTMRPHPMLSPAIRRTFERGVTAWRAHGRLRLLVDDQADAASPALRPFLAELDAADFIADPRLHEEVFGSAALVVRVNSIEQSAAVLRAAGGSLTVTLWGVPDDEPAADVQRLVRSATQIAGRVLFAGVPTGVSVTAAQHHGGPYPASTVPSSTSVGFSAMDRFLRPVALQDAPSWLMARRGVPA